MLLSSTASGRSLKYKRNRVGPRMDPGGTPEQMCNGSDVAPLIVTRCRRSVKCFFCLFYSTKFSFVDRATNVFGRRTVLQANLRNKINFFSAYSWTLVPQEVTQDFFYGSQLMLTRLPKMASNYWLLIV